MSRELPRGGGKRRELRLQMQRRRLAEEEETRRKEEETRRELLLEEVQKELRESAAKRQKRDEGWRKMLSQVQDPEQRKEILALQQNNERYLDELDDTIETLAGDLQKQELQGSQEKQSHLQQLEVLRTQQDKREKMLQQQWDSFLQDISSNNSTETDQLLCSIQQQRTRLQEEQLCAKRHAEKRTAEDQKLLEKLQTQEEDLLGKTDGLKDLQTVRRKAIDMSKNKTLNEDSSKNKRISADLKDRLVQLKQNMDSMQAEKVQLDQDLDASTNATKQKCLQLRKQLARGRQAARQKLVDLITRADAATKKLQGVISQGEKILRRAELCHKLQSKLKVSTVEHEQTFCESGNLQHHLNVALQRRQLLRNQKQDLIRENHQMELLLQQSKDGPLMVSPALSWFVPPDATSADGTALCGGATAPPDGPTDSDS